MAKTQERKRNLFERVDAGLPRQIFFKSVIINIFKEQEVMYEELMESTRIISHCIKNVNDETKMSLKIPNTCFQLKSKITEMKIHQKC